MSATEIRYAQIEKEALAVTWACEKFSDYILGLKFQIESDHKPLIPILSTKHLDNLPPRFRPRLAKYMYNYTIHHVKCIQQTPYPELQVKSLTTGQIYQRR